MKIGIIIGSIREGRKGGSVGRWVLEQAQARQDEGVELEVLDLRSFDVPLLTSATVPGAAKKQYDSEQVTRWSRAVDACDAFIFVTPEYNHGVPGGFKNAYDSLGSEWDGKPVAFVSYGAEGGVRAVEHWRARRLQLLDDRRASAAVAVDIYRVRGRAGHAGRAPRRGDEHAHGPAREDHPHGARLTPEQV